jgi:putative transcriptional regulator
MGRKAFQAIAEGLEDAIAFTQGEKARGHVHRVRARDVDVVATRERLGLSQAEFATAFGVSVSTVRNWEQGRRTPEGPALVLLTLLIQKVVSLAGNRRHSGDGIPAGS